MATVYKREGIYYAKYFDADGKRVSRNTGQTVKRDAEREAARFELEARQARHAETELPRKYAGLIELATREAASGKLTLAKAEDFIRKLHDYANPEAEGKTLETFWRDWIAEQRRHVSASTATGYDDDLELFAAALGKRAMAAPVVDLTADQIAAAMDKARKTCAGKGKKKRRASTVNKALSSLRRVLEAAIAKGLATHNPAKQTRALRQDDSADRAPFTIQEVRAMITHKDTSEEWRGAITIAAHTGLRLRDVLALNRKHVDGTRLVVMPQKTKRSKKVITVPLTPPCLAWIGDRKGDFFLTLKKLPSSNASMQFSAIMKRAGIPKETELPGGFKATRSFHALRHTFTSWLADADIHADVRQRLTGHSSAGIHAKYTHHDEALDRAVAALPAL